MDFKLSIFWTYLFLIYLLQTVSTRSVLQPICCFPQQFESFMIGNEGYVDMPSSGKVGYGYMYANGTLKAVYDAVNQRSFIHERSLSFMSLFPMPIPQDAITIVDYKNNVQWHLYNDGTCDKMEAGYAFFKECIPGNATMMSRGSFGQGQTITTYLFRDRIYLDPYEITVTVVMPDNTPGECIPIRISTSQAYVFDSDKNVDISVVEVVDFTEGIRDPSVFIPPSSCDKATTVKKFDERYAYNGLLGSVARLKWKRHA